MSKPYRPSSGTEGADFQDSWCCHCQRDAKFNGITGEDGCQILADTFAFNVDDPRYPKQWIYGRDGQPKCTAYTEDPKCPVRCDRTLDLFAEPGHAAD